MRVLTVNAGSSSLKLAVLAGDEALAAEELEVSGDGLDEDRLAEALRGMDGIDAVGHRVVHGGHHLTGPVRVDARIREELGALVDLAPLHQPKSLRALDAVGRALPGVPAVACFDTAFFAGLPAGAATYALPREWRERYGLRRFGFHGLSHAWASSRAAQLAGGRAGSRVVVAHLGSGCSLSAVVDGRAVDTTMGFTPLEGLVMGTRSGTVDPGLLLWLEEHEGIPPREVADSLEHRSGLLGLCGTADMREVLRRAAGRDADAALALDTWVHRVVTGVGAMAAAAGGLDVLVFTGGVGERAAPVRRLVAARLEFLGVRVDDDANDLADGGTDADIGAGEARVLVVRVREDVEIARQVRQVLGG
ncbi:MAG: acetate/propionate family kinase [Oryzihumus sp.]